MQRPRLQTFVVLLFACSGISGLIYEIAWSKYLSLLMGSTAYSHMFVLATFMGGLAWGAWYWGRAADRSPNPLRLYAALELVIGAYCAVYPLLMLGAEKVFLGAASGFDLSSHPALLTFLKCILSISTLLLPTFCMGGTLPILLKPLTRNLSESGPMVARLYWMNSLGAVAGAALAGFFLIRLISLDGALWVGAAINIVVGFVALALSRSARPLEAEKAARTASEPASRFTSLAILVACVSGFVAMVYELSWIRLLTTLLGSSTYSFTVMLIAFISGIVLGSWIVSKILARKNDLLGLLAWCQIGTAIFMIATLPLYERLPYYLWKLSGLLSNDPGAFAVFIFCEFGFCFALMIVPTTLSGMSLPVAGRIASGDITALGKSIGGIFSVNTIGAVAGALVTGLILIPAVGVKQSIEIAVLINAGLGVVVLLKDPNVPGTRAAAICALIVLAGVAYRVEVPKWDENISSVGVYRAFFKEAPPSYGEFLTELQARTVLWYKEGVTANVAVNEFTNDDGRRERSLVINGKTDASTEHDLPTQVLLAQIPMMLASDSSDVLVIGLGSGITPGSVLQHPVRTVECVEISQEVVDCNGYFADANHQVLQDPRFHLIVDDAITYVKVHPKKYAAIISEPSNPWIAGIGNLFTEEFFDLCKDRLEDHGVLAQWFHTYDVDDSVFTLVLRTLSRSFPHVMVWAPTDLDVVLIGSKEPISPDFDEMSRRLRDPLVAGELARIQMRGLPAFLSTQISGRGLNEAGPVNSEKRPLLEFLAPISFFTHAHVEFTGAIDRRDSSGDTTLLQSVLDRRLSLNAEDYLNIARYQWNVADADYRRTVEALHACLRLDPQKKEALELYATVAGAMNQTEERVGALQRLAAIEPDDPVYLSAYAVEYFSWRQSENSPTLKEESAMPIRVMERAVELSHRNDERYLMRLAEMLTVADRSQEAGEMYAAAVTFRQQYEPMETEITDEELLTKTASAYLDAGDPSAAEQYVTRLKSGYPASSGLPQLEQKLTEIKERK